ISLSHSQNLIELVSTPERTRTEGRNPTDSKPSGWDR
ncbi:hypothetical protein AVEN_124592-1, partial [Araneus ventricosus]